MACITECVAQPLDCQCGRGTEWSNSETSGEPLQEAGNTLVIVVYRGELLGICDGTWRHSDKTVLMCCACLVSTSEVRMLVILVFSK